MKFHITRTSDYEFYSVIEAEHLEDCIRQLQGCSREFVVSIITEDKKNDLDCRFDDMVYGEDGDFELVVDEKHAEAYRSCDFEVEIYDTYRE